MKFVINMIPKAKQSGTIKKGRTSLYVAKNKRVKDFEQDFAYEVLAIKNKSRFKLITGMVRIKNILYVFPAKGPKQKSYLERCIVSGIIPYKSTKPDLTDNLQKAWVDACNGLLWKDDSLIVEISGIVRKIYGHVPRIEFEVEEIEHLEERFRDK